MHKYDKLLIIIVKCVVKSKKYEKKKNELCNKNDCIICLDNTCKHIILNKCSHVMTICDECINDSLLECPVCRTHNTSYKKYMLFNQKS